MKPCNTCGRAETGHDDRDHDYEPRWSLATSNAPAPRGKSDSDGEDCHLCSCAGQVTPATTTRVVCDLGARVDWRGEHIHPLCDQCAEQINGEEASR